MLKLGKLTDYGVAVTGYLWRQSTGSASASAIAGATGLPEPTVAKVLKLLGKGGLVASARGSAGGYRLAKPGSEISLAAIVTAVEGPIEIVACVDGKSASCVHAAACPSHGRWDKVNRAVRASLEEISLAEMLETKPLIGIGSIHVDRP